MSSVAKIPIFPLGVVLMPQGSLPLHIFEERYKQMIAECLSGNRLFGVVYFENKHLHKIGCTAHIEKVIKQYEDGRLDILTSGQKRFRILDIAEDKPYLESNIEYFDDEITLDSLEMADLARHGVKLLRQIEKITEISEGLERVKTLDLKVISFLLAGSHGLTLAEKQELLEIENTEARLTRSVDMLKSAIDRAKLLRQIRNVRTDILMMHGFSRN